MRNGGGSWRWRLAIRPSPAGPYKWKMRVAQVDAAEEARRARVASVLGQVKRIEVLAALPPALKRRPQMATFAEVGGDGRSFLAPAIISDSCVTAAKRPPNGCVTAAERAKP